MSVLIEKAKSYLKQIAESIAWYMDILREKVGDCLGVHPVSQGLVYSEKEKQMIFDAAELLTQHFPGSPGELLLAENIESRCEAVEDFGAALAERLGLECCEIVVTDSPEVFGYDIPPKNYGVVMSDQGRIYINAYFLYAQDDPYPPERVLSTVIHELRHLVQYQVAALKRNDGVPFERRRAWRENALHYIRREVDPEGFYYQPLEVDARSFTGLVWRAAYGEDIINE